MCPQLSSTSSWLGAGNILCAAKSTQELIVLIIGVSSHEEYVVQALLACSIPFIGFAQYWYRLAQETDRNFCLSVALWTPLSR